MNGFGFGLTMALGIVCSSAALLGTISLPAAPSWDPAPIASAEVAGLSAVSNAAPTVVTEASPVRPPAEDVSTQAAPPAQDVGMPGDNAKSEQLLALMNEGRRAERVAPLARDAALDSVARARAEDLVRKDYFDHYGPDGESAFTELAAQGFWYRIAGENLARNNYPADDSVEVAYRALMSSPGHRANIVEARFERVGVAAVQSGRTWLYVTVFTD